MQVFKAFFKTVARQKMSIAVYLGVFIALSVFLTNMQSENSLTNFTATKIDIAVFDYDDSAYSHALYEYLDRTQNIIVIDDDNETIADDLFYRNVMYVLRINKGFSEDFTQLTNIKQAGSAPGQLLDSAIDQYVSLLDSCKSAGYSSSEAIAISDKAIDSSVHTEISSKETSSAGSMINIYFGFVPYIIISVLTICLGVVLNIFRSKELSSRIQCSSMSIIKRNVSMALCSLLLSIGAWGLISIISILMFRNIVFTPTGILYLLNSFVFMLVALSMTYMISFFVHTDSALNMTANVVGLGMSFLSGIFVPLEFLSDQVISVAKFLPAYWYVLANNYATDYNGGSLRGSSYLSYLGIELLFAAAFFAISLAVSKLKKTA